MVESVMSAAVVVVLYLNPIVPPEVHAADSRLVVPSLSAAAGTFRPALRSMNARQTASPRDSLKNGAIIGAVAGAATGAFLAAIGCGLGDLWGGENDSGCVGGTTILVAMGAGIGALIGVGIDAMFERAPVPGLPATGKRIGVRLRMTF